MCPAAAPLWRNTLEANKKANRLTALRIALLLLACAFIAIGVSRGEMAIVLKKAVNICLECIGLG